MSPVMMVITRTNDRTLCVEWRQWRRQADGCLAQANEERNLSGKWLTVLWAQSSLMADGLSEAILRCCSHHSRSSQTSQLSESSRLNTVCFLFFDRDSRRCWVQFNLCFNSGLCQPHTVENIQSRAAFVTSSKMRLWHLFPLEACSMGIHMPCLGSSVSDPYLQAYQMLRAFVLPFQKKGWVGDLSNNTVCWLFNTVKELYFLLGSGNFWEQSRKYVADILCRPGFDSRPRSLSHRLPFTQVPGGMPYAQGMPPPRVQCKTTARKQANALYQSELVPFPWGCLHWHWVYDA